MHTLILKRCCVKLLCILFIIIIIIIIIIHFKDMNKPGGHMSVKNTKSEEN